MSQESNSAQLQYLKALLLYKDAAAAVKTLSKL